MINLAHPQRQTSIETPDDFSKKPTLQVATNPSEQEEIRIAVPRPRIESPPEPLLAKLRYSTVGEVIEGLREKEAEYTMKMATLRRIVDRTLEKLPWLEPEGIAKLKSLREKPDGDALQKGSSEHSLSTYLVKAAGEDEEAQKDALAFYGKLYDLAYAVITLKSATIPTYRKAIAQLQQNIPGAEEAQRVTVPPPRLDPSAAQSRSGIQPKAANRPVHDLAA